MMYIISRRKKIFSRWGKIYVLFISPFFSLECCHASQSNVVSALSTYSHSNICKQKYFGLYKFKSGQWRGNKKRSFMQKTVSKFCLIKASTQSQKAILDTSTHSSIIHSCTKSSNSVYLQKWFGIMCTLHWVIFSSSYKNENT